MYGPDIAAYVDTVDRPTTTAAGNLMVAALHEAGLTRGTVIDAGCGGGHASSILLDAGFGVMAFDAAPSMVRRASSVAKAAEPRKGRLGAMALPKGTVGIVCVGEVLNHDVDIDIDEVMHSFAASLRRGGVLLIDVAGPGRHGAGSEDHIDTGQEMVLAMRTEERGFRLTRQITLMTREESGRYRRRDETHELRLHPPEDVLSSLARAGFVAIRQLASYGGDSVEFGPGRCAVLASRG